MSTELEKYKKALDYVVSELAANRSCPPSLYAEATRNITAILNPPPEYEEVTETAGWVNVFYDGGKVYTGNHTYATKEDADNSTCSPARISCEEIKVKVKREKKKPVVKSISGKAAFILDESHVNFRQKVLALAPWMDEMPTGIEGTLTFTWTELED